MLYVWSLLLEAQRCTSFYSQKLCPFGCSENGEMKRETTPSNDDSTSTISTEKCVGRVNWIMANQTDLFTNSHHWWRRWNQNDYMAQDVVVITSGNRLDHIIVFSFLFYQPNSHPQCSIFRSWMISKVLKLNRILKSHIRTSDQSPNTLTAYTQYKSNKYISEMARITNESTSHLMQTMCKQSNNQ